MLEDGTEYHTVSMVDMTLVSNLMSTMKICEEELLNAHNISFELH